ncbi:hypothetical protein [Daejeonella sp.]|uniref:hypothetical protein n=1 Tax=Daejeonella sp. TaxID=2805397 RepID=UPI002730D197|nr:hypothetical protein [Daejeonella sp.]MDP2415413.1 hypothetical protein [Daejeonella sp.]
MPIKKATYHFNAKPALLCLLLSFFLLTDCTVKKSIQALVDGNNSIENTNPNAKRQLVVSSQTCLNLAPSILDEVDLQITQFAKPVLPLIPILLSHIPAFSFQNQYYTPTSYFSRAAFLQTGTPLYLRNRILLI